MEIMEVYNQIQDPLKDPNTIMKLLEIYSSGKNFYSGLVKTVDKEHDKGDYYRIDSDKFYSMLFNKWKNSIVNLTREEFEVLYKKGHFGIDFIKLRSYLKNIPDVSTRKEADEIFYGKKNDEELEIAMDKYRWSAFGEGSGSWTHVCSRYLTAKKDKYPNVEHRLYLNTESLDTYKLTYLFVQKCDKYHLPFYFKYDIYGNRDDTMVIYSSTENLTKYIDILQEIKKENPELVSRMKTPPLLTGKIDGWIGYGSEPAKTPDGATHSFNEIRSEVIRQAIDSVTRKWLMNNRYKMLSYRGQTFSLQDYLALKSTENLLVYLEKDYRWVENRLKKQCQREGKTFNEQNVINEVGYTLQDISSSNIKQSIFNVLKRNFENDITVLCNQGRFINIPDIKFSIRNGKFFSFTRSDLYHNIQKEIPLIAKNDSNYISNVRNQIILNGKQKGIDTDKFCFDISAKSKMQDYSNKIAIQRKEEQKKLSSATTNNIDINNVNVATICDLINPVLMTKKMKLPNGVEVSAYQYIQEAVYFQLPKNGIVILENGTVLPVKQFIEENIMFECQEKYNGDLWKYIATKTRNNLGVISIEVDGEKKEINPVNIVKYINPTLLNRKVKLPNGVEISAYQYIQEIYAPHIPTSGMVTLIDNSEISVQQFIEKNLFEEGQTKYNGDIGQILYRTTRNNNGTINANPKEFKEKLEELKKQTLKASIEEKTEKENLKKSSSDLGNPIIQKEVTTNSGEKKVIYISNQYPRIIESVDYTDRFNGKK